MSGLALRFALLCGAVIATSAACASIVGDFTFVDRDGGTGAGGGSATSTTGSGGAGTGGVNASSTSSTSSSGSGGAGTGGTTASSTSTSSSSSGSTCTETLCGSSCVDLQMDKANCGRCGHDCLYGTCSAGKCQAWTVAAGVDFGGSLNADGTYLSFAGQYRDVHQVKVSGGAVSTVTGSLDLSPQPGSGPVLRNGTLVYNSASEIYTVPEGTTTPTAASSVPASTYTTTYLAVNPGATTAFLIGQANAAPYQVFLLQCLLGGGSCGPLGGAIASPGTPGYAVGPLVVNATYAFWGLTNAPTSGFVRYTFATSTTTTITTQYVQNPALDSVNVYWSASPAYTIYALPLAFTSGATPVTVASSAKAIGGIAGDGTNAYYGTTDLSGAAQLYYVAAGGGGTPTSMYTSPHTMGSSESNLVAAAGAIYWADGDFSQCPETYDIKGIAAP